MAWSIGSTGLTALARKAATISRCCSALGAAGTGRAPASVARATTRMWLRVSVPVLSTQSSVAAPSVSVTELRRTSTLRRARR